MTYSKDLALAQIILDKKTGAERFNEYRQALFPWLETAQKREKDSFKQLLEKVVKEGPLSIKRAGGPERIKSRLVKRLSAPSPEHQRKQQNALYKRLPKTIPL